MAFTITAEQRDALYDQILDRLSGIGDVWVSVERRDYSAASRLGRAYTDDLLLVMEDLGWGEGTGAPVELTASPDLLRRALSRLRDAATSHTASHEKEWAEGRQMEERNRLVAQACRQVLADLGNTERQ